MNCWSANHCNTGLRFENSSWQVSQRGCYLWQKLSRREKVESWFLRIWKLSLIVKKKLKFLRIVSCLLSRRGVSGIQFSRIESCSLVWKHSVLSVWYREVAARCLQIENHRTKAVVNHHWLTSEFYIIHFTEIWIPMKRRKNVLAKNFNLITFWNIADNLSKYCITEGLRSFRRPLGLIDDFHYVPWTFYFAMRH